MLTDVDVDCDVEDVEIDVLVELVEVVIPPETVFLTDKE